MDQKIMFTIEGLVSGDYKLYRRDGSARIHIVTRDEVHVLWEQLPESTATHDELVAAVNSSLITWFDATTADGASIISFTRQ